MEDWYSLRNIDTVDSPALIVYPDRIRENIRILKSFVTDTSRLRPHVKTNKSPDISKLLLDAGITKFKCATIAEAEMLADIGAPDILLAYQPVGPKADRLAALIKRYPKVLFGCLTDSTVVAQHLSDVAHSNSVTFRLYLDLNVGMNRTGIIPERALELWMTCKQLPDVEPVGLHAYDGHLRDPDLTVRSRECDEGFAKVIELKNKIREQTGDEPMVVAGGTPTFPIHARRSDVECSPGTFILWDKGYQQILSEQPFLFAGIVLTRVISQPSANIICVDLGHKAIASENPLINRVTFLNGPGLTPIGHSEEHLVLKMDGTKTYTVGDVLYGVPYHICPTVALHETVVIANDNTATATWPILSRKRKLTI